MNNRSVNSISRVFIIALAVVSIALITFHTVLSMGKLDWNNWAFFEWLINYQSGFVRRGLVGELIHELAYGNEIYWLNALVFLTGVSLVVLLAVFSLRIGRVDSRAAILYSVAPSGFFWMAMSNQFYYRKEALFYLVIVGSGLLYLAWRENKSRHAAMGILGLIAGSSLLLPFIHEAFVFFCLLYFSMLMNKVVGHYVSKPMTRWILGLFVVLNIGLFVMLSLYKGGVEQSQAIWASLSPAARAFAVPDGLYGGISAIGWSIGKELALSLITVLSGMGSYYLFALLIVYLIVGYLFAAISGQGLGKACRDRRFNGTFVVVFLSFLPLFAMGGDWGRWVVGIFIVSSTMMACGILVETEHMPSVLARLVSRPSLGFVLFVSLFTLSLVTRIPECCIGGPGDSYYHNRLVAQFVSSLRGNPE